MLTLFNSFISIADLLLSMYNILYEVSAASPLKTKNYQYIIQNILYLRCTDLPPEGYIFEDTALCRIVVIFTFQQKKSTNVLPHKHMQQLIVSLYLCSYIQIIVNVTDVLLNSNLIERQLDKFMLSDRGSCSKCCRVCTILVRTILVFMSNSARKGVFGVYILAKRRRCTHCHMPLYSSKH